MKVFVMAKAGRRIPGLGSRAYGEFYDVPKAVADQLLAMPGFDKRLPGDDDQQKVTAEKPKQTQKSPEQEAALEENNNAS